LGTALVVSLSNHKLGGSSFDPSTSSGSSRAQSRDDKLRVVLSNVDDDRYILSEALILHRLRMSGESKGSGRAEVIMR
jgi:hypothetical protein